MRAPAILRIGLILVLIGSAALRFAGMAWDDLIGAHPDERYLVGIAEAMRWPSRADPYPIDPSYPYGHLPLYLLGAGMRVAPDTDGLIVARAFTAGVSVCTVGLVYMLARQLGSADAALLAATLVGFAPLHVQAAHFATVDVPLTLFTSASLLFSVRLATGGLGRDTVAAGAAAGLAMASKASALWLVFPLVAGVLLAPLPRGRGLPTGAACFASAAAAFTLVSPHALVSLPQHVRNLAQQAAIARGVLEVPFTRQFTGTLPYAYPLAQQLQWGAGWIPGLVAVAAVTLVTVDAAKGRAPRPALLLLAFVLPWVAFFGALRAKYPRYLLPLFPPMAALTAQALVDGRLRPLPNLDVCKGDKVPSRAAGVDGTWRSAVAVLIVAALVTRSLALVRMYRAPHPWTEISEWFASNAEPDAIVAVEAWDQPLPTCGPAVEHVVLSVYADDTIAKWRTIGAALNEASYLAIASRRAYATLARQPERYPETAVFYRLLFAGDLGYEAVACFNREAALGPLSFGDEPTYGLPFDLPELCRSTDGRTRRASLVVGRLDESLVVYDHPTAIVFARTGSVPSPDELWAILAGD